MNVDNSNCTIITYTDMTVCIIVSHNVLYAIDCRDSPFLHGLSYCNSAYLQYSLFYPHCLLPPPPPHLTSVPEDTYWNVIGYSVSLFVFGPVS